MKVIRIFNAQPVKIPYFNTPLTRKTSTVTPFFIAFQIMNYAKFQKKFDSRTIPKELP